MMPQLLILLEENYSEVQLYETYNKNAQIRFDGIKSLIKAGDKRRSSSVDWNQFKKADKSRRFTTKVKQS
jgi:hypothetical protein